MKEFTTVRKLKLTVVGESKEEINEKYKFIRDSQYAQYQGLNVSMGILASGYLNGNRDLKSQSFIDAQKSLTNSNPLFDGIEFGKGIDSKSAITQRAKKDFKTSLKNGLAKGERSLTNYKRDYPLLTRGRLLKFYYDDNDIFVKWVNGIVFKVVLGSRKNENSVELQHALYKIVKGDWKVNESSLYFDKNNHLMINLNLTFKKDVSNDYVKDRALGIDLGIAVPAVATVSDNTYNTKYFGSADDFIRVRKSIQDQKKRCQKSLSYANGGHGRKKKLKPLERFQEKERNFCKTYNHQLSSKIVNMAKTEKCEYINLEKLTKEGFDNAILRNWSYYELQTMIEYKAQREGIKVRFVNPAYTSQTCSCCGHVSSDNRKSQKDFACTKCGMKMNADKNASINIARSTNYVK